MASPMESDSLVHATMRPASNGKCFVTFSTYQERQEALKRTTIMEDDVNHRTMPRTCALADKSMASPPKSAATSATTTTNGETASNDQQLHIPPPPPQFANNQTGSGIRSTNGQLNGSHTAQQQSFEPPHSPVPDYDSVPFHNGNGTNSTNGEMQLKNLNGKKRTNIRHATVTIGEYDAAAMRRQPEKFDFIGNNQRRYANHHGHSNHNHNHNHNHNQNNNYNYNHNHNHNHNPDDNDDAKNSKNLQTELQMTLSRSKLKQSNGHQLEHQSNCEHNNYVNYHHKNGHITTTTANATTISSSSSSSSSAVQMSTTTTPSVTTTGILKNGNRSNYSKSIEKTIKFGN